MEASQVFQPRPYRRAWWLPGAHLQTIGGWLLRRGGGVGFRRERLGTPDGDFIDLDFVVSHAGESLEQRDPAAPVVLVVHGLEGSSRARPALQALRELAARGIQGVALNLRSCSGEQNRSARSYHAGETGDLELALQRLGQVFPGSPLAVLGYSLGGNILLKYLGEQGAEASGRLKAAAAISIPFDLAAGARKLERGSGRIYAAHFLRSLQRKLRQKTTLVEGRCSVQRAASARTLRDFDDAATAPLHGFRNADHYYSVCSSSLFLPAIRVPTLLLHSADDPFLPPEAVPYDCTRSNPLLTSVFTRYGGHMGFISGRRPWRPEYWAEAEAVRFLSEHLTAAAQSPTAAARSAVQHDSAMQEQYSESLIGDLTDG